MRTTKKQIADAFRAAQRRIASGRSTFICRALETIEDRNTPGWQGAVAARQVVADRMGTRVGSAKSLEYWLSQRGVSVGTNSRRVMRDYRLRWLDALIKEFDPPKGKRP